MAKNISVFGLYSSEGAVADGVDQLRLAGFRNTDVSVLFSENSGNKDLAHEKNTKAPEGAAAGAGSGAVLGGALGWLAGIGLLAVPGLGPFIAAGPIMGLLGGIGVGGTIGGLTGALIGSGCPSMRPSATRVESAGEVSCCRYIATTRIWKSRRSGSSKTRALRMSPRTAKRKPISERAIRRIPGRRLHSPGVNTIPRGCRFVTTWLYRKLADEPG